MGELANPVELGVRQAAEIDKSATEDPSIAESVPPYVPRDIDVQLDTAVSRGGLVLVVGDAGTGKSRVAYEAMRRLPHDMSLLVPESLESLRELASSRVELANTVVWLDDFERYLGPGGLDVAILKALIGSGNRVVVLATMRTTEYFARSSGRKVDRGDQEYDPIHERKLLDQGEWVYVERRLSQSEYQRAIELTPDPGFAVALTHSEDRWWAVLAQHSRRQDP